MMRRVVVSRIIGGCVAVLGCGTTGCSDAPRTIVTAAPLQNTSTNNAKTITFAKRPVESDPAAVEAIQKALRAHTGGHIEKLNKLKTVRLTLNGLMVNASGARIPSTVTAACVWPNRMRYVFENTGAERARLTIGRDGDELWMQNASAQNLAATRDSVPTQLRREVLNDSAAYWFWLLGAISEPGALFQKRVDLGQGDKPLTAIQIWRDGFPDAVLYLDPETAKLARVIYDGDVAGQRVQKRFDLSEEYVSGGITFPGKLLLSANDRVLGDWQVTSVEFPDSIDSQEFREP